MQPIDLTHLLTVRFEVTAPRPLGKTPYGERRIVQITGGTFEGERLRGTVIPEGGDWLLLRHDGVLQLDVRATLQTDDNELIYVTYRGYRHGPEEVIARLARGERVDPSEYYFRMAPFFETASERYDWLNRIVAVGTGERLPTTAVYTIYEVR
jgi:hypothetical protein